MPTALSTAVITAAAKTLIPPSLTFPNYMSAPIPVILKNDIFLAFMVGRGEVANSKIGYQVWPPKFLAFFDLYSAQFHELRAVTPGNFSINQLTNEPIGTGVSPPEKLSDAYIEKELHLFQHCDNLIAAHLSGEDTAQQLAHYDQSFQKAGDSALLPYFQKMRLAQVSTV